ncbi:DNA/RNA non-specific endonuclease [Sphingomonas mollis]|uniref:DNA/RNA non-specific endonuclease n=1 Tax=Sphingomonas mollis TaxID=2795726 RepID=UPI003A0FED00
MLSNTRRVGERATVFTGPVFRQYDPVYRSVAIPLAYWKVVAFVHDDGRPSASAYLIDHDVDLTEQTLLFGALDRGADRSRLRRLAPIRWFLERGA